MNNRNSKFEAPAYRQAGAIRIKHECSEFEMCKEECLES